MINSVSFWLAWLAVISNCAAAIPPAQVRLDCLSLRFSTAVTTLGQGYTLELGTAEGPNGPNGELAPTFDSALPSHGTSFRLTDPTFPEPMGGDLVVEVPDVGDENANGFADFFEMSQAVPSTRTSGAYAGPVDNGDVTATWSRAAGSNLGTCRLKFTSRMFGELPEFNAQFELIEYSGTLQYTPGATNVEGTIHLVQPANPASTLEGPAHFVRSETNRFDQVNLDAGAWKNADAQMLNFTNSIIFRDLTVRTNYYGLIDFADGDLATAGADYLTWQISIDDVNDSDKDGIPDFTDDPSNQNGSPPSLRISRVNNGAQLEINGEVGKSYEVQETLSLTVINWVTDSVVTLTNQTQVVELSKLEKLMSFWRVKVP